MRFSYFTVSIFWAALLCAAQLAAGKNADLPKDPQAILAMAAPFYDYSNPALKPWHLKATYQFYDYQSRSTEQGTFEYWWVSPKVHRASWSRPESSWTDWHTPDGEHFFLASGERPKYFEQKIESILFWPLPNTAELNPYKTRLDLDEKPGKGAMFPCIALAPVQSKNHDPSAGLDTYCFDPRLPVLRLRLTPGGLRTEFDDIASYQGRYLAREIVVSFGDRKVFSLSVDSVNGIKDSDPALTPAANATNYESDLSRNTIGPEIAEGMLIKKVPPVYPAVAKETDQRGVVILEGIIGTDGLVHDLDVGFAPSELLAAAARDAVSHWKYKPYLLHGKPVEVKSTFNVFFFLNH